MSKATEEQLRREYKIHPECRHVPASGVGTEIVACPWCSYPVSTSNPAKWCAGCYTLFVLEHGRAHFGKRLPKSFAVALAIAMQKSGGVRFGSVTDEEPRE